jgi:hypothetical protein
MEDPDAEVREPGELRDVGEDDDAPMPAHGLGAIGQLAVGVLVVALLIAAFIGTSAALRRIFG